MNNRKFSALQLTVIGIACLMTGAVAGIGLSCNLETYVHDNLMKIRKNLKTCERRNKNLQELRSSKTNDMNWTHVNITKILKKADSILNSLPVCDTAAIDAVRELARQNAEFQRRKLTGCLPTKLNCKHPINVMECRVEIFHNDRSNEYLICRIVKKK